MPCPSHKCGPRPVPRATRLFSAWEAAPPVPQIAPPPHLPDAAPREESSDNPKGSPQPHSSTRLSPSGPIECFFACSAAMVKHCTAICFIGFQGKTPREEAAGENPNGTPQPHSRTRLDPIRIHKACSSGPNLKAPLSRRRFSSPCNINTAPFPRHLPQQLLPSCIGTYARKLRVYTCPYIDI